MTVSVHLIIHSLTQHVFICENSDLGTTLGTCQHWADALPFPGLPNEESHKSKPISLGIDFALQSANIYGANSHASRSDSLLDEKH